jgi:HSP20 family protein
MANITVRKENGGALATTRPAEWDPLRVAREVLRWDPFREMTPFFGLPLEQMASFAPAFEVKETKEGYLFKADVPGVKESDLDIQYTGNRLTISGKREQDREEKSDTYYTYERSYGTFTRAFTLPEGVDADHIHAEMKEGVLNLVVPKKPEAQPKKISLKPTAPTEKKS